MNPNFLKIWRNVFHKQIIEPHSPRGLLGNRRYPAFGLAALVLWTFASSSYATLLWTDLGTTQVHETGAGNDILGGVLQRDDSSTDTLYFKFHVDPISDANTEFYFAAFQLFEGEHERLAVGNSLEAWAYSAFATGETSPSNQADAFIDLNSANPEPSGIGTFHTYELVHSGIERTIIFKVQYVLGGKDLVTAWLDPDLSPGATEASQPTNLTTHFNANASFDQIHLRHGGGGGGWVFSEMAIATSFSDFVNASGSGAPGETPFMFRSWQQEQGLPENYVRAVAQTRDGYIWIGTDEGVDRFDGVSFFALGPQEGFQGGPVQVLYGDTRGALWIGSVDGGLSCWQAGKLTKFTAADGLPSDSITALAEDHNGNLWVGTQSGLVLYQNGHLMPLSGAEIFSGKPITTIFRDRIGTMWVGATGEGIYHYQDGRFIQLRDAALDNLLVDPHCVLVDDKGRVWIGAGDAFVVCHDGNQWLRFGMPKHLATHYISTLTEAPDDTVWAGSVGEGLFEFKSGKLVAVNAGSGLSDNLVEALLVDAEGKLWVGTHGGLNRITPEKVAVLNHSQGLNYGSVQGLAEVAPGKLWVVQPDGVYQWDDRIFRHLTINQLAPQEPSVSAVLAAQDGSCWIAGTRGLLHFKNPLNVEAEVAEEWLTNLMIGALADDLHGGVWAGTRKGSLWHFTDGKWKAEANYPQGHAITAIIPDKNGNLWIGTGGDGLYTIDEGSSQFKKVNGLSSDWIRILFLDNQDILWIGTAGGGLSRLEDGQVATFTMRDGLLDNTISQILEDDYGDLWLGGDRGVVRIKKDDLDELAARKIPAVYPQIYGRSDGMLSEECASGFFPEGLRTKAGLLYFPTLKGVAVVDPHHTQNSPPPTVILEQVLEDGVPQLPVTAQNGGESNRTERGSSSIESLRLGPGKHTVEFHYTGLSFDAPERVRFRYRLSGLDPSWVEAGTRRVAFYSFVPPGSYRFEVVACNSDGIWNDSGASLELTVLPHIWQTWWFISATAVAIIIVVVGSARVVVRQRLKRLEQERVLERERTRIAQDLHDSMGAKLCRISFLSEHARNCQAVPGELQEDIRSISDDSREVLQSLDEIVWAVNPQKDTLDHLVCYIGQFAQEYFKRTGIECELEMPPSVPARTVSSQSRHHLFLAVHEALANILKHSQATRAKIAMSCHNGDFAIKVSDNGTGFDPVSSPSDSLVSAAGFCNGLGNMRQRMANLGGRCVVDSKVGAGTTIQFLLYLNKNVK
jgi:ligand-binding sensor domain-containing protein/signal transduction histidine kinase